MTFSDILAAGSLKDEAEAHVFLLARCCWNVLRTVLPSSLLASIGIDQVAALDLPAFGSAGAEEIAAASAGGAYPITSAHYHLAPQADHPLPMLCGGRFTPVPLAGAIECRLGWIDT